MINFQQPKNHIDNFLIDYFKNDSKLESAMNYGVLNGGKRIRAILVYLIGELLEVEKHTLDIIAAAIEMVHAFSLIHDDLPAMDNDELRRGKPTCHIAFDEATAILAGDTLLNEAFELLSNCPTSNLAAEDRLDLIKILSNAIGKNGMAQGQMLDIAAENKSISLQELQNIHRLKTGALIKACALMPLTCSKYKNDLKTKQCLEDYTHHLGIAFQIQDDILDATSDAKTLGKTPGKDQEQNKSTYLTLLGFDRAKKEAQNHFEKTLAALKNFDDKAKNLQTLANFIITRNY